MNTLFKYVLLIVAVISTALLLLLYIGGNDFIKLCILGSCVTCCCWFGYYIVSRDHTNQTQLRTNGDNSNDVDC